MKDTQKEGFKDLMKEFSKIMSEELLKIARDTKKDTPTRIGAYLDYHTMTSLTPTREVGPEQLKELTEQLKELTEQITNEILLLIK